MDLWYDMHGDRDASLGVQMLKFRDIMAYSEAFNFDLLPFEIECIRAIDREFVKAHG